MPCSTYVDEEHSILVKSSCIRHCTYILPRRISGAVYIYIGLGNELDKVHGLIFPPYNNKKSWVTLADHDICLSFQLQEIIDFLATGKSRYFAQPQPNIHCLFFIYAAFNSSMSMCGI